MNELERGRKTSHWMWYIFPQIAGLGTSAMSRRYALCGLDEACAYLAHPVLGSRLRACVRALEKSGRDAHAILGSPDDMKLRSCLTLFMAAAPDEMLFREALDRFFGGHGDPATFARL